jgi:hypothetical protein
MRGFKKLPWGLDIFTLLAVVALVTVVYLCALPETLHSLQHRKSNAADLMGQTHELIVREGMLFGSLVQATDDKTAVRLRRQLMENERRFHEIASAFSDELPEANPDIEAMTTQFDHMAAAGWRAAAAAPRTSPEERETLLDGAFTRDLDELRNNSDRMQLSLQRPDAASHSQARNSVPRATFSL